MVFNGYTVGLAGVQPTSNKRSKCHSESQLPRAPNGLKPASGRGGRGAFCSASSGVEIFDCGDAAQVEEILARAAVAGLRSLSGSEMSEAMFDAGPCPQSFAASWRSLELA